MGSFKDYGIHAFIIINFNQLANTVRETLKELKELINVVSKLRDPEEGCPWNLEQTHKSLLKYMVEEAYEFVGSAERENFEEMKDELGDVLLQVLLHSQMASEKSKFTLEDVCQNLKEKLIRRHPHVFSKDSQKITPEQVKINWEKIKEKECNSQKKYEIDEKVLDAPALKAADKIGKKTRELNFDWDDPSQVSYKVEEEWQELKEEIAAYPRINRDRIEEEMGDFLFSVAQFSRHLDFDPETTLRNANKKFLKRFQKLEELLKQKDISFQDMDQQSLDHYWFQVKELTSK